MSPTSQFPRIVVIKSFNQDCIEGIVQKVGKYTHIQSLNGVFLDGMSIGEVTKVFKASQATEVQLLVRYVHPLKDGVPPPNKPFPGTPANLKPEAPKCNIDTEILPIPLFILGDINSLCTELFRLLSLDAESPVSDVSQSTQSLLQEEEPETFTLYSEHGDAESIISDWSESGYTGSMTSLNTIGSYSMIDDVFRQYSIKVKSDAVFKRALVPSSLFSSLPLLPESPESPDTHTFHRQTHAIPDTAKKHFILHLYKKEHDRHFAHIYLRSSGMYLITTSLDDMLDDPLIQFENLCYWLRLVETYIAPKDIKRIIIVGVYEASDRLQLTKIEKCMEALNEALREADFKQIMPHSRNRYVFPFNKSSDSTFSRKQLCAYINKSLEKANEQAFYLEPEFFESTMTPFSGFASVLTSISKMEKVVATADEISSLYGYHSPNYFKTLEAYSTACIGTSGEDSLIKPLFLQELLKSMMLNTQDTSVFTPNSKELKELPVVIGPVANRQMDNLVAKGQFQLDASKQDQVLHWAEKLELIFNIGVKDRKVHYLVPFLATGESPSYRWSESEAKSLCKTVLYASLHFPATHNFFCRVIAELLKSFLKDGKRGNKCYINLGCMEAILPLKCTTPSHDLPVYLKYHPLQNIIEFRTKAKQQMPLYTAVESLLRATLSESKYRHSNWNEAVSFSIPSQDPIDQTALWKLGGISIDSDGDSGDEEEDRRETELLKTKPFTEKASWDPQVKKQIPYTTLNHWSKRLGGADSNKWAIVGSRLGLMDVATINHYMQYPYKNGNGKFVFIKWQESSLSHTELTRVLHSQEVGLVELAEDIDSFFSY